jgi:hypothetical protein
MKTITIFKCDYCGIIRRTLKGIWTHEVQCYKNPNSLNCYLCENAFVDTNGDPCCEVKEDLIETNLAEKCDRYINCHTTIHERLRNELDGKYK